MRGPLEADTLRQLSHSLPDKRDIGSRIFAKRETKKEKIQVNRNKIRICEVFQSGSVEEKKV